MGERIEVTACYARVPSGAATDAAALSHLLDDDERRRVQRFHFERDRLIFVAAHALLWAMLHDRLGNWRGRLRVDAFGKPELDPPAGNPPLRFNLTHTDGLVACALVANCDIGIDAERMEGSRPFLEMAEDNFADAEIAQLRAAHGTARIACFYRIWTLKEAIIKAIGEGLSLPLKRFAFTLAPLSLTIDNGDALEWHVEEFRGLPGHAMALAVRQPRAVPIAVSWREAAFVRDGSGRLLVDLAHG